MQEWSDEQHSRSISEFASVCFSFRYNANIHHPYPRSPDKKRFITEGNITAQQCRSWFANRRQRLKHVKRSNQSKSLPIQTTRPVPHR